MNSIRLMIFTELELNEDLSYEKIISGFTTSIFLKNKEYAEKFKDKLLNNYPNCEVLEEELDDGFSDGYDDEKIIEFINKVEEHLKDKIQAYRYAKAMNKNLDETTGYINLESQIKNDINFLNTFDKIGLFEKMFETPLI